MDTLDLIRLTGLTGQSPGVRDIVVGLIDGPVDGDHPGFGGVYFNETRSGNRTICASYDNAACIHGTFIAGILFANRHSGAPGLCPGCTALLRPIFVESSASDDHLPIATPEDLAEAIVDCVSAGAHILNLSLAVIWPSSAGERTLTDALDWAARNNVIVIAAAGNQGTVGGSVITRHPWVIPVVACDEAGWPLRDATLAGSIGRRGLRSPGAGITSLGPRGGKVTLSGTSVAAPFVTGAAALLWSRFPSVSAGQVKLALVGSSGPRRSSIVPPILDGAKAYAALQGLQRRPAP